VALILDTGPLYASLDRSDADHAACRSLIESADVEDLQFADYARVRGLCDRYADADIGFVDAAVLAIAERLGERKLASLDHRHFGTLRPRHCDALTLLPA
jgi:predicted nucleic acid-binding protein